MDKLLNDKAAYARLLGVPMESPSPNKECIFPFVFEGVLYERCTNRGGAIPVSTHHFEGKLFKPFWCATQIDPDEVMVDGE